MSGGIAVSSVGAVLDALDLALLELVQRAPQGTPAQLRAAAEHAIYLALEAAHGGATASAEDRFAEDLIGLGCAMERCLELIGEGRVDAGVALPALAMAAHTARSSYAPGLTAARYEIETLLPIPGKATPPRKTLDVPTSNLLRRPARNPEAGGPGSPSPAMSDGAGDTPGAAAIPASRLAEQYASYPEAASARVERARQTLRQGRAFVSA